MARVTSARRAGREAGETDSPVCIFLSHPPVPGTNQLQVWYEQVTVSRPMVPERDKDAVERRVFPTEVGHCIRSVKQ